MRPDDLWLRLWRTAPTPRDYEIEDLTEFPRPLKVAANLIEGMRKDEKQNDDGKETNGKHGKEDGGKETRAKEAREEEVKKKPPISGG